MFAAAEPVAVGAELVFNALVVADVREDAVEPPHLAVRVGGDEQAALQHELQQAYSLEGDGLASGVRAGDDEHAGVGAELQGLGFRAGSGAGVAQQQQRVVGVDEVKSRGFTQGGEVGPHFECEFGPGLRPI